MNSSLYLVLPIQDPAFADFSFQGVIDVDAQTDSPVSSASK